MKAILLAFVLFLFASLSAQAQIKSKIKHIDSIIVIYDFPFNESFKYNKDNYFYENWARIKPDAYKTFKESYNVGMKLFINDVARDIMMEELPLYAFGGRLIKEPFLDFNKKSKIYLFADTKNDTIKGRAGREDDKYGINWTDSVNLRYLNNGLQYIDVIHFDKKGEPIMQSYLSMLLLDYISVRFPLTFHLKTWGLVSLEDIKAQNYTIEIGNHQMNAYDFLVDTLIPNRVPFAYVAVMPKKRIKQTIDYFDIDFNTIERKGIKHAILRILNPTKYYEFTNYYSMVFEKERYQLLMQSYNAEAILKFLEEDYQKYNPSSPKNQIYKTP